MNYNYEIEQDSSIPEIDFRPRFEKFSQSYMLFIAYLPNSGHILIKGNQVVTSHSEPANPFKDFLDANSPKRLMHFIERYELILEKLYDRAKTLGTISPCNKNILREELSNYPGFRESDLDYIINHYGAFETGAMGVDDQLKLGTPAIRYDYLADYASMWNMLDLAISLRHMIDDGNVTRALLEDVGFIIDGISYRVPVDISDFKHYANFFIESPISLSNNNQVEANFLYQKASDKYLYLETDETYSPHQINPENPDEVANEFLNYLIGLHTSEISLVPIGRQQPTLYKPTLLSQIWFSLYDAFEVGRIGRCQECKRLFVAGKERGTSRKFCSDRCRKANSRKRKLANPALGPSRDGAVRDSSSKQKKGG